MPHDKYAALTNRKFRYFGMFQPERFDYISHPPQNMMLKQVRFPHELRKDERFAEFWQDRIPPEKWAKALLKIVSTSDRPETWFWEATEESFLAMAQFLVGRKFKVTGAIIVRYTDEITLKPILRVIAVGMKRPRKVHSDNSGEHLLNLPREMWRGISQDHPTNIPGWDGVERRSPLRQ